AKELNDHIESKYKVKELVRSLYNYTVNFNYDLIDKHAINIDDLKRDCINYLKRQPGISFVIDMAKAGDASVPALVKENAINGYNFKRSGEIMIMLESGWYSAYALTGTTHGNWHSYDTHIPMVF